MFLWESIALTSLAGYVGLVLGWGILKVVALFISEDTPMMEKPGLDFPTAVAAIFILVISGNIGRAEAGDICGGTEPCRKL
ncbi:MAG: hypothetical protein ACLUVG_01770 [Phocaeicola vulgatus]